MAAPATLMLAKILVPETREPLTRGTVKLEVERTTSNVIDAAATGAADGLRLALNVGAMLLAFIALIALVNAPIQWLGGTHWGGATPARRSTRGCPRTQAGRSSSRLQTLFGWVLAPLAWLIGVPWQDANLVGSFIGEKVVINEFVAYVDMSKHLGQLTQRKPAVATYALCGLRELLFDRDPDRRHRRACAEPAARSRAPGPSRGARRLACDVHDGDDRGRARAALRPKTFGAHSAPISPFTNASRVSSRFTARFAYSIRESGTPTAQAAGAGTFKEIGPCKVAVFHRQAFSSSRRWRYRAPPRRSIATPRRLELTQAVTAVQTAERDDAARYAPADLDEAHSMLGSAQNAADGRSWDNTALYAERAKVAGDLASARSRQHRAESATAEIERSVDSLRREIGATP